MPLYDVFWCSDDGSEYAPVGQVCATSEEDAVKTAAEQFDEDENDLIAQGK